MTEKHLHGYKNEFDGRQNTKDHDTIVQMIIPALSLVGKRLQYMESVAD